MVENYYPSVYLAYLDFLGFSSFVEQIFDAINDETIDNSKEEKLKRKMEHMKYQYENKVIHLIEGEMVGYQTINTHRKYLGREIHIPDFNSSQFNSLIFSDSVFIWTENDSFETFKKLVFAINRIIKFHREVLSLFFMNTREQNIILKRIKGKSPIAILKEGLENLLNLLNFRLFISL